MPGRSPLASTLKVVVSLAVVVSLGMLVWSSVLVEEQVQKMRSEVAELREEVSRQKGQAISQPASTSPQQLQTKLENKFPNLLEKDPFYEGALCQHAPQGARRVAMTARPDHLHPFSNWAHVRTLAGYCTDQLGHRHVGHYGRWGPGMAERIEAHPQEDGGVEYWVFLRPNLFWEPIDPEHLPARLQLSSHFEQRHPVTARDFQFYYNAMINPHVGEQGAVALRPYYSQVEEVRVVDDRTLVVRWKGREGKVPYTSFQLTASLSPLPCWVFQYYADGTKIISDDTDPSIYRSHSVWAQQFTNHWARSILISCGPWLFDGMTQQRICYLRNPNYYEPRAVLSERMEVAFKETPELVWHAMKVGQIDQCELNSQQEAHYEQFVQSNDYLHQSETGGGLNRIDLVRRAYTYIGWNNQLPLFDSRQVRQALTLAIDRNRLVEELLAGWAVPITGPFFCEDAATDPGVAPWPYDPATAAELLEADGWLIAGSDGIRQKLVDGVVQRFQFRLLYYSRDLRTRLLAQAISSQLSQIGVCCIPFGVDLADLTASLDEKKFDAVMMGWGLGVPPEEPRQIWHSEGARLKGSSNFIGFANPEVDRLIEQLEYEQDPAARLKAYHQIHQCIHDEAPYVFLFTPKTSLLYRDWVHNLFVPTARPDLISGADVTEPYQESIWIDRSGTS
jgi:peptide/nickel transport system substrate-binding protein